VVEAALAEGGDDRVELGADAGHRLAFGTCGSCPSPGAAASSDRRGEPL
jgi:hypothetical protein